MFKMHTITHVRAFIAPFFHASIPCIICHFFTIFLLPHRYRVLLGLKGLIFTRVGILSLDKKENYAAKLIGISVPNYEKDNTKIAKIIECIEMYYFLLMVLLFKKKFKNSLVLLND